MEIKVYEPSTLRILFSPSSPTTTPSTSMSNSIWPTTVRVPPKPKSAARTPIAPASSNVRKAPVVHVRAI